MNRVFGEIKKTFSIFINSSKRIKSLVFCGISVFAILFSFLFAGTTFALQVDYDGKNIATVKSEQDFEDAVTIVTKSVYGSNVKDAVKKPVYSTALVLAKDIDDKNQVAQAIIENTDEIVYAQSLVIDGNTVAKVTEDGMDKLLDKQLERFNIEGTDSTSSFTSNVSLEKGYFLANEICNLEEASAIIEKLEVTTVVHSSTKATIPFTTTTRNNNKQLRGYSSVIQAGKNGVSLINEDITYINGKEVSRKAIKNEVITEPVTQIVEVGTARSIVSANDKKIAQNSGFIFPLPRKGWVVSAYFGDGRNHRAVDIACSAGTSIYAVKSGKVVQAGRDGDYGLSIVIDHGNGIQTRYSHEKEIFVKVGDTVNAGEEIGTVGRTGNASGNHLHFEVIINGNRVDPAPYIGLA